MKSTLSKRIIIAGFIGFVLMVVNDFFLPYNPLMTIYNFIVYWAVSCLFVTVIQDIFEKRKILKAVIEILHSICTLILMESFSFLVSKPIAEQENSDILFSIFGISFVGFIVLYCILGEMDNISKNEM